MKQLQEEVARLEAERQNPNPSSSSCLKSLLMEKDLKIQEMEREVNELKRQRDLAQSQLELERKARKEQKGLNQYGPSSQVVKSLSFPVKNEAVPCSRRTPDHRAINRRATVRQSANSTDPSMLFHEIRKLEQLQRQLGEEANLALQVLHKEVASRRLGTLDATETIAKLLSEIKDMKVVPIPEETMMMGVDNEAKANLKEEITRLHSQGSTIASLEKKLENVQKSIDRLVLYFPGEETPDSKTPQLKKKKVLPFSLSNSSNMQSIIIRSPCSPLTSARNDIENKAPAEDNATPLKSDDMSSREGTPSKRQTNSVNVKKMQRMFKNAAEENIRSIRAYVTELKERVAKLQYQKHLLVCQVLELEPDARAATNAMTDVTGQSPMSWHLIFEDQRKQIVMLWHLCHVSIIHRTQFYMLFKGDPADQIYLEVELRRLTWLEQHLAELGNASPALLGDEPAGSVSSSIRALKQEREYLAKRVSSRLTAEEREMLYVKWEVPAVGKQRRLQLVNKLWTDPYNMQHVQESAEIVAKLVGFCESGEHVSKEMFELNFVSPSDKKPWMGWNLISNLLHL